MIDEKIFSLIRAKNQEGLSLLIDKYGGLISYISKNIGNLNSEDMCECVSDVIFLIWQNIDKFDIAKASFKTWITIITHNCTIDYIRKTNKNKTVPIDNIIDTAVTEYDFELLNTNKIIELLDKLPPPDNEIFYRRFLLGEEVKLIATSLNASEDSIYKRILRGRKKFKKILVEEGY